MYVYIYMYMYTHMHTRQADKPPHLQLAARPRVHPRQVLLLLLHLLHKFLQCHLRRLRPYSPAALLPLLLLHRCPQRSVYTLICVPAVCLLLRWGCRGVQSLCAPARPFTVRVGGRDGRVAAVIRPFARHARLRLRVSRQNLRAGEVCAGWC